MSLFNQPPDPDVIRRDVALELIGFQFGAHERLTSLAAMLCLPISPFGGNPARRQAGYLETRLAALRLRADQTQQSHEESKT